MSPDEIGKHTTPNAIRDATDAQLDERYNFAVGHLRGTDEGLLRQTQISIRAILDEVARRRGKKAWLLSLVSVGVAIIAVVNAVWVGLQSDRSRQFAAESLDILSKRVTVIEANKAPEEIDATDISPSPNFIYSDTIVGTIVRSSLAKDVATQITFVGLTTSTPRIMFTNSGSSSPMKVLGDTEGMITIQSFTGHSVDTFIIDKKTGLFSRSYSGTAAGCYAGGAIGKCK